MLSSTATTTIDRDETEELGKALGLDFALTFLFLPRPFASANKPAEQDPPEKVLLDAKKIDLNLVKKEFDEEGKISDGMSGMRLSYFGARYYDAEVGVWTSKDRAEDFWSGYSYSMNPITDVDPDGNSIWSMLQPLFPVTSTVIRFASAINSADNVAGFGWGLLAAVWDFSASSLYDMIAPASFSFSATAALTGNWGASGKWEKGWQSMWDNETVTWGNAVNSGSFLGFAGGMTQDGSNSLYEFGKLAHYALGRDTKYYGTMEDGDGYNAQVWGFPNFNARTNSATTLGHHIGMNSGFYTWDPGDGYWDEYDGLYYERRNDLARHEMAHVRQSSTYGGGGIFVKNRMAYRKAYNRYNLSHYAEGSKEYDAILQYGDGVNELEFEAQMAIRRGAPTLYYPGGRIEGATSASWFDVSSQISSW